MASTDRMYKPMVSTVGKNGALHCITQQVELLCNRLKINAVSVPAKRGRAGGKRFRNTTYQLWLRPYGKKATVLLPARNAAIQRCILFVGLLNSFQTGREQATALRSMQLILQDDS